MTTQHKIVFPRYHHKQSAEVFYLSAHQMFIGDGAKLVRDAFALAKEKAPAIIFIDELDAIGTKVKQVEVDGNREPKHRCF